MFILENALIAQSTLLDFIFALCYFKCTISTITSRSLVTKHKLLMSELQDRRALTLIVRSFQTVLINVTFHLLEHKTQWPPENIPKESQKREGGECITHLSNAAVDIGVQWTGRRKTGCKPKAFKSMPNQLLTSILIYFIVSLLLVQCLATAEDKFRI